MPPGRLSTYHPSDKRHSTIDKNVQPRDANNLARMSRIVETNDGPNQTANMTDRMSRVHLDSNRAADAESYVGSVSSRVDKGHVNTRATDYRLGDIIRIPHVAPNLDPYARRTDSSIGCVEMTGPVVGKLRPAIVVGIYPTGLICLVAWTSQGKGIHHTEIENCVWLRDCDDVDPIWNGAKETEYLVVRPGIELPGSSYLKLTHPTPVCFAYPIKRLGALTDDSWNRLKELWDISTQKGFLRLSEQRAYAELEISKIRSTNDFEKTRRRYKEWKGKR